MANRKKRKKHKREFQIPEGLMGMLAVLTAVLLCFRGLSLSRVAGVYGSACYSVAFGWFAILCVLSGVSFAYGVKTMVMLRLERGNAVAAKQVVTVALGIVFLSGAVLSVFGFLAAEWLSAAALGLAGAALPMRALAAAVLPMAISAVLLGALDGFGVENAARGIKIVFCSVSVITAGGCIRPLYAYGQKVGALLQNEYYAPAYGALGAAVSLLIGALLALLFAAVAWIWNGHEIKLRVRMEGGERENKKLIARNVLIQSLPVAMPALLASVFFVAQQLLYMRTSSENIVSGAEELGTYTGAIGVWAVLPAACAVLFAAYMLPELKVGFVKRNLKRSRDKCMLSLRCSALFTVPLAIFLCITAKVLLNTYFEGIVMNSAVQMLRVNCLALVLFGLASVLGAVLVSVDMLRSFLADMVISALVSLLGLSVMQNALHMGISAVACSNVLLAFLLCATFFFSAGRQLRMKINWLRVFLAPLVGGAVMAAVCAVFSLAVLKNAPGLLNVIVSGLIGFVVYFISVSALKGLTPRELRAYPGGEYLIKVAQMFRLM